MKTPKTCYTCERPATGVEHVPPRGIFPKHLRNGIITVPACERHNNDKKLEDEYFRNAVVSVLENNEDGIPVVESIVRSWEYKPHLMKTFLPNFKKVVANGRETGAFTVDIRRFNLSARYIVRALWFHETGEKLHADLAVHWRNFFNKDGSQNPLLDILLQAEGLPQADYKGAQPTIFQYDFHKIPKNRKWIRICRMRFFKGPPVCAFWHGRDPAEPGWRKKKPAS